MRKTHALLQVAFTLMEDPSGRHWGYDSMKRSGIRSGVLYPILQRMLVDRWLSDGWEDPTEIEGRRPPRRYYKLTEKGCRELGAIISEAETDARFAPLIAGMRGSLA
jgi:PadR family transcriptional regulator PadR